jgi:dimethylargininase
MERQVIDVPLAVHQHREYEERLADLGCRVQRLPPTPELPDSVFVEDVAVVLDELAIITRPGASSRASETRTAAEVLQAHRLLTYIRPPGTLDGGDVLVHQRQIFIGLSGRSNSAAVAQVRALVEPYGYAVTGVPVQGCLHLKTGATVVGENMLLLNPDWVEPSAFMEMRRIEVDPSEPFAGNALLLNGEIIFPAECHRTRARLESQGVRVSPVEFSELAKAEAGVTCCSVIFAA